ncbi:unnamed protein product, partial [Dicrocoelium dendriticum]
EIELSDYSCFRCDRPSTVQGSVLHHSRSTMCGRIVSVYKSEDGLCEQLWCSIHLRRGELLVGAFYRSSLSSCLDLLPHLRSHMSRPHVLVMRDFNCPRMCWTEVELMPGHCEVETKFVLSST